MKSPIVISLEHFVKQDAADEFAISTLTYHLEHHHKQIDRPHKHNFYTTVLFTKGSGIHEVDFEVFDIKPGAVFMLHPGRTHHWELSADVEGMIFFHTENFYNEFFAQNALATYPFFASTKNTPYIQLSENECMQMAQVFQQLWLEYQQNNPFKLRMIRILVDSVYIQLTRLSSGATNSTIQYASYAEKLIELEQLIDQHFMREKSPAQYAAWMNITPKHLNRIVRSSINKTTTQLITERVILEAKRMLSHPHVQLSEIAEKLGFEEYAYFSKLFKKYTGVTPVNFKQKYNG